MCIVLHIFASGRKAQYALDKNLLSSQLINLLRPGPRRGVAIGPDTYAQMYLSLIRHIEELLIHARTPEQTNMLLRELAKAMAATTVKKLPADIHQLVAKYVSKTASPSPCES